MSKLKAWHILLPTVILFIAGPITVWFTSVKKAQEEITTIDEAIAAARKTASLKDVETANLKQAQLETGVVTKELSQVKNAKLPLWSGNPWWRTMRQGMALSPGAASLRVGESGTIVNLPEGMPAMFDMWFLLREDLGVMLRDYFDSTGVQVDCALNMPNPRIAPYTAQDMLMLIPLPNVRVQGKYSDVLRFFRRLGYAPILIAPEGGVTIRPVGNSADGLVEATTTLNVILFPNLPPDRMADLQTLFAGAGGGAVAAGAPGAAARPGAPAGGGAPVTGGAAISGGASQRPSGGGGAGGGPPGSGLPAGA